MESKAKARRERRRTAARERSSADRAPVATVLVVDDDRRTCGIVEQLLGVEGCAVRSAASGAEAVIVLASASFDLMLVNLKLPDMSGTALVRAVNNGAHATPFIIVGRVLTIPTVVEAMKMGALQVLEEPLDGDLLVATVRAVIPRRSAGPRTDRVLAQTVSARAAGFPRNVLADPRSTVERWASLVVKACTSETDLKTLVGWAKFAGVSYTSVCETCRLTGIRPHDARDLARVLRALVQSRIHRCHVEALLDVSDRRTLRTLLGRAGLAGDGPSQSVTVEQFLNAQRFVSTDNDGLRLLRSVLVGRERPF